MALLHEKLDTIPKQFHFLMVQILTAAQMTIASLCKTNIAPNVLETIKKVKNSAQYERILAYGTGSIQKCYNNWNCWLYEFLIKDT